nr:type I polyketide synthase [Saccharopolyspora dendranthemae]
MAAEDAGFVTGQPVDPDTTMAVVGVSCRFPGAEDPQRLWRLLAEGGSSVSEVSAGRWSGAAAEEAPRWGAFLEHPEEFDAAFFGISPREAPYVDPQQRLALELGWEALENARIAPDRVRGTRLGTFVGVSHDDYAQLISSHAHALATEHAFTGVQRGVIANRMAAFLGARGPSITVDSSQASSLVALHLACGSLRGEESDIALVCGVNLHLLPQSVLLASRLGALSPQGRCFTFDERADGYAPGEGGGAVVLKRLRTALADGDRVLCLVRGSATTNDPDGDTLTAPTVAAQAETLSRAYRQAGIAPDTVDYVELHGTGTPTGDPVEAAALGEVLGSRRPADQPLAVGSVKTNIGHLSGAAGIAGFIKTVLALAHRQLPASLNFDTPHPRIPLEELNLRVQRQLGPWPDGPLVAGVSSFGMGGTNCHVVLSDWRPEPEPDQPRSDLPVVPWLLSARSEEALRDAASRLADTGAADPAEVASSLVSTRTAFDHRAAIVAGSRDDLVAGARALAGGGTAPEVLTSADDVTVVFSGDRPEGGEGLARFPVFAEALAEVCELFDDVAAEIADDVRSQADIGAEIRRGIAGGTPSTDPVLADAEAFAFGVAAWRLASSWGVVPSSVSGYATGELLAAHVSGARSLRDSARSLLAGERVIAPAELPVTTPDTAPFLEIGASTSLTTLIRALAALWIRGDDVDWEPLLGSGRQVDLPTYPFQRRRFWLDVDAPADDAPSSPAPSGAEMSDMLALVREQVGLVTRETDSVDTALTFRELGFSSLMIEELAAKLSARTGLSLAAGTVFGHPTPSALAEYLRALLTGEEATPETRDRQVTGEPLAIVGMACRYPGGIDSPDALWDFVASGSDAIGEPPANRGWDLTSGAATVGGFLHEAGDFDAEFFGIAPREAVAMDPQQRLLLETSWEALEHAGLDPSGLRGSATGVYVGATTHDYGPRAHCAPDHLTGYLLTGGTPSVLSGRIAYALGLEGPAVTVDTACSSSLVALHLAGQALRSGECDVALAGGVTVMATPGMFVEFGRQGGLAADGRCKPFSADADGTSWAEGVGVLALERLSDAQRNGHRILAVVRGSAVNQDGASNGLTAPSGPSQRRVIRAALASAGLSAEDVDAVEAHGTGTRLGDPIEAQALAEAYGRDRRPQRPLWLGSLKSNIGHSQAAAGVAGVIKMVQAMRHETLPATLHSHEPTPRVEWASSGLQLLAESRDWLDEGRPRRAGVSSFGISGTNAHVIVEEPPIVVEQARGESSAVPWVLSGRDGSALRDQARRLVDFVGARPDESIVDVGAALAGRAAHEHRAVAVGADQGELLESVRAVARGVAVAEAGTAESRAVFVFPGQGSQWAGMAVDLLAESPVFAARMEECAVALESIMDFGLLDVLADADALERVDVVQPVLWAVMVSLAAVWRSYGVEPAAVVGHSQGEIAAAVVAGSLSLEDGARVVVLRSRAVAAELAGRGGMAAVRASSEETGRLLGDLADVSVAAMNGPATTVVSGAPEALTALEERCGAEGVRFRWIPVDYASHSAQVEALEERLLADLAPVEARPAVVPFFSTVTGSWLGEQPLDAEYWYRNLRHPVRFEEAVRAVSAEGFGVFVECSPHTVLTQDIEHTADSAGRDAVVVGSLQRDAGDQRQLLTALGEAFTRGVPVDWSAAFADLGARTVDLPTYAFQRQHYWLDADAGTLDVSAAGLTPARHPLLGAAVHTADGGSLLLTGRIDAQTHAWLHDHTVGDVALLPATALLELAVQAGDRYGTPHVDELVLHAPLVLGDATDLQITVAAADEPGRATATIHARPAIEDEPWTLHATATLGAALATPPASDWAANWPFPGATPVDTGAHYADLADTGYAYGPAFRGLGRLWTDPDGTVYAEAELPLPELDGTGYAIHPALLDAALHAVLGDELRLPYAFGDVAVHTTGARALRARLARAGRGDVSIDLADVNGRPVAAIGALTTRPADATRLGDATGTAARSLFSVEWDELPVSDSPPTGTWALLSGDENPLELGLPSGTATHRDLGELRAVLDAGTAPDVLVWLVPRTDGDPVTSAHAHATTALDTARALLLDDRMTAARLLVVTEGATGPEAATDIAAATVWGLLRTAQTETPGRFVLVDTDRHPESVRLLPSTTAGAEPQLALRAGRAHAPRLARATAGEAASPFGPEGTVLLTGASGRIGGLLARRLVHEHGVRRLLCLTRGGADATRELTGELTEAGCAVTTLACDPADRDALAAALQTAGEPISAVVHAAGALADGAVTSLTAEQLATVLRPKVDAAWNLHELTREEPLSAFVLLSSVSGVLGTSGQANYAAGNAFLDALAAHRAHLGLPGQALAWGVWEQDDRGGGMASGLDDTDRARLARLGVVGLPEDEALALFDSAVADPRPLLVPAKLDVRSVRERAARDGVPPLLRRMVPPPVAEDSSFPDRLEALAPGERHGLALALVRTQAAAVLRFDSPERIHPTRPFQDIGLDSLGSVELRNRLNTETGERLPAGLLFDHPTPTALAAYLVDRLVESTDEPVPVVEETVQAAATADEPEPDDDPVAIVGMACRFPGGVTDPESLWELVFTGGVGIGPFPTDRGWDLDALYHPDPDHPRTSYTREGGFLHGAGDFDAGFFGISPREALAMDPQQRLLLETSWEALEHAGLDPSGLRGSATGVFAGQVYHDYALPLDQTPENVESLMLTGNTGSVLSGRVAYAFGFEGPAVTVDTACSSSLVALHLAGQALRSGECDVALAGGVTVMATPSAFVHFGRQRGLAPDGRCKPFSAAADGTGFSEGAGVLALERLSDARRKGHRVLAVVRGSAVNQDGASNGLTAPNGPSQQRVIRAALANAGLAPDEVDAVEAHGTGTTLGDPIEADALLSTYGVDRSSQRPLWLGSVKSNLGHTQAAAGVAGVIKMVQAMRRGVLPASLHADEPTPHVDWSSGGVRLLAESREWLGDRPRRAGVSSFGISGTNAHVIIEQPPVVDEPAGRGATSAVPWVISGRSAAALRGQAERLAERLRARPDESIVDVGASLLGRAVHEHRAVVVGSGQDELLDGVRALADGAGVSGQVRGEDGAPRVALVFPGQGSQWPGMAVELLTESPVFASRMRECAAALKPHVDVPLLRILSNADALERAELVQPALWAVMVSLAAVWESYGVRPAAVVGHSQGEIAAAVVAGSLSLEDGARAVALRSRAIAAELAGRGGMAVVRVSAARSHRLVEDLAEVSLAAMNGPATTVVSGTPAGLDALEARCGAQDVRFRRVAVDYASHSAQVDALRDRILADLGPIEARPADVPFFSTVTGGWLGQEVPDAAYWARNLRHPVRFEEAVRALAAEGFDAFIECSPHAVLTGDIEHTLEVAGHEAAVVGSLLRDAGDQRQLLTSLGEAFVHGVPVDWTPAFAGTENRLVDLPTYAFQHERYWWDAPAVSRKSTEDSGFWAAVNHEDASVLAETLDVDAASLLPVLPALRAWNRDRASTDEVASWRYRTRWVPASMPAAPILTGSWLLVVPTGSADHAVADAIRDHGGDVITFDVDVNETREDIARRLDRRSYAGVLSLLSAADHPATEGGVSRVGLTATVALVQALADAGIDAPLWCLTREAVTATDEDARTPRDDAAAQHMVWGLGRIIALEHPERFGGLVDLPARPDARTGGSLAGVLSGTTGEDQVALRPTGAHVRRLARTSGSCPAWRPRGTVLITGGTGGLGAAVARHLARTGAEHLVLASRRGPDAPGSAELRAELEAADVQVTIASCDVGDRADLARLLEACSPTAVVHTAAVLDDGLVHDLTPDQLDRVLRVKADGAWHLHELTRDLDAFVLFSSVAGTFGASGQGNYAPGNAYLDALAEQRHALGLPATSIAWGIWDERGMATEDGIGAMARRHGLPVMAPELAATALRAVTGDGDPAVVVADVEWDRFHAAYTATRPSPFLADLPDLRRLAEVDAPAAHATTPAGRLAAMGGRAEQQAALLRIVREQVAGVLGHAGPDAIDPATSYRDLGFDSVTAVELRNQLNRVTGLRLPSTIVFDHPSARALATYLHGELLGDAPESASTPATVVDDDPIVIVGMSCRFPGDVDSPEALWRLLEAGGDAISPFPEDRGWDIERLGNGDGPGSSCAREGGFLHDAGDFDADFFGISPREALAMDPQQRLMLETSWEALEDTGIDPTTLRGTRAAVFTGSNGGDYLAMGPGAPDEAVGYAGTGNIGSVLSGRVAYVLGTEGPAITVDTACSSSLVALHLAARSLRHGECDLALTGGVTVMSTPGIFTEFTHQGGLAPDGRSKAFAANADGAGFAEGVGVLVVERQSDARRNGHRVLAVVRGSAVNQDGASNGLTAPNGVAQQRVIRAALSDAGVDAGDVDVVEAHGTGTKLGDPIEAGALLATYGQGRDADRPLWLGSVKSNIGHTQAAAGVAGIIKSVLALRYARLPRTLHADEPTTHVDWSSGALRLLARSRDWPDAESPRRAGVSSFGVSGTNAHVVLEQGPDEEVALSGAVPDGEIVPWPVTAKSDAALREQALRLLPLLDDASPAEIGHALATTRARFDHRAVVLGASTAERRAALDGLDGPDVVRGTSASSDERVVFVFPGQGSQWAGMARELWESSPVFAARMGECAAALESCVDFALLDVLADAEALERVDVVQPALWAVMVSLAEVWRSHGVEPAAVVGHSQGEIAAAVVAGGLSLEDGARVVALRSRAVAAGLSGYGGMAAVRASSEEVRRLLGDLAEVSVAAMNGPTTTVVSGTPEALAALEERCGADGVRFQWVAVDYASHSAQVEALEERVLTDLASVEARRAEVPFFSTVTNSWLGEQVPDAAYWYRNLRNPVRFEESVRSLVGLGFRHFVEVSPHPVLTPGIEETAGDVEISAVGTLRRDEGGHERVLRSLAEAFVAGAPVEWVYEGVGARRVNLPTYPFQRRRFWLRHHGAGDAAAHGMAATGHALLGSGVMLPGTDGHLFTGRLSLHDQPWTADHEVLGRVVLPGTAFLDMVLHAADAVGCGHVAELTLETPLVLTGTTQVQVLVAAPGDDGDREVTVHAQDDPDHAWTLHARATVTTVAPEESADLAGWPPAGARPVELAGVYERLGEDGLAYGPVFRGLEAVWRNGEEIYAEVALPEEVEAAGFGVHPALLDAALHAWLSCAETSAVRLPFLWSGVSLHATGATRLRVRLTPSEDAISVLVADTDGRPVLTARSLVTRPVTETAFPAPPSNGPALYRVEWTSTTGPELAAGPRLAVLGETEDFPASHPDVAGCRDLAELEKRLTVGALPVPEQVLVEMPTPSGEQMPSAAEQAARNALELVQRWLASEPFLASRLVLVTRGAVGVESDGVADLAASPLWGLVRSAQTEHPGRFALLDVDPGGTTPDAVLRALAADEPQLAIRGGEVLIPRLVPDETRATAGEAGPTWHLDTGGSGTLEGLAWVPDPTADDRELGEFEVRVEVRAAGVNFRDVLVVLGMYPDAENAVLGSEAAGVVTEIGSGVTSVCIGDRVMGVWQGTYRSSIVVDERTVVSVPTGWSFETAASVPVAFVTAYYALVDLADLKAGESVLIHAAAGGVGMAAVQLARHLGAEVCATASEPKWPVVRDLGVPEERIASSRNGDFEKLFGGVDVVLDSLAGELVDASLRLTRPRGRFVEMGKADVRDPDEIAATYGGVKYRAFDLAEAGGARLGEILREVARLFDAGALQLLPTKVWDAREAEEAFWFMSRARHVGKLVLTMPREEPEGWVVVTGASGVLGGVVARHVAAEWGVRRLLLLSRRGHQAPGADELVRELTAAGVEVRVAACDVADRDSLADALSVADGGISGVVHAAGTLDDVTVESLTPQRLADVLAAKVAGAWNLHELTADDVRWFVLFSSAAGVLGGAGQANYAAGNAFLDGLAAFRRARGLPGVSVAWGLWEQRSAMTEGLDDTDLTRMARTGVLPMSNEDALRLLDAATTSARGLVLAADLDTSATDAGLFRDSARRPARRRAASGSEPRPDGAPLARSLAGLGEDERRRAVLRAVCEQAATVLGHPSAASIPVEQGFLHMGFDSLTAVELRNRLNTATGLRLPATLVFDHPDPARLADHLAAELTPTDTAESALSAELDLLDTALGDPGAAPDDATRGLVAARLQSLLSRWTVAPGDGSHDVAENLESAGADELFDFIDQQFGSD